jgi:predicted phosphodiesterase
MFGHPMPLLAKEIDLVIIAGDYDKSQNAVHTARTRSMELPLVLVAGNNEHHNNKMSVAEDLEEMKRSAKYDRVKNFRPTYVLENETVNIELKDEWLRVIGCTLWTDFSIFGNTEESELYTSSGIDDYRLIKGNIGQGELLTPAETAAWHRQSRRFIEQELRKPFVGKTIVVTHHLPSIRSVTPRYLNDPLTPSLASNCDDLLELGADLWVHGHIHDSVDYMAGKTRVVCNPKGYPRYHQDGSPENKYFREDLVIEI